MKKSTTKKEKFDALKTFCNLSRELEGSKSAMFNLYMPEFFDAPDLSEDDEEDGGLSLARGRHRRQMSLTASKMPAVRKELANFTKYLKMSEIETLLVVAAYTKAIGDCDSAFDMRECVDYFDLNAVDFMPLRRYFSKLVEDGIFIRISNSHRLVYKLETSLAESIQNNTPYVKSEKKELDRYAFCAYVSDMIEERTNTGQSSRYLFQNVEMLENQNPNIKFVQNVKKLVPDSEERTLFYECCDDFIVETRYHETGLESTLSDIYDSMRRRMNTLSFV